MDGMLLSISVLFDRVWYLCTWEDASDSVELN